MKRKCVLFSIAILAAMIIATTALSGCGCNDTNSATPDSAAATIDEAATNTTETIATDANGETIAADNASTNNTENNSKAATAATTANAGNAQNNKNDNKATNNNTNNAADKNTNNSGNSTNTNKNGNSGNANTTNSNNSKNGKTWHEAIYEDVYHPAQTKRVKVVDQAAYSYEEPVYDYVYHAICNTCGADITNDPVAHTKVHTLAHEGGSWSDVPKYEQTGTKTVNVPEQSHYETQVVKAAWTEHKLVREAGWY